MRSQFLKTAVAALLVLGLFVGTTWAKKTHKATEPSKPQYKDYKGTVEVTKDKAGDIKAVELKVGLIIKHTYHIALDEKGKELGQNMAGKKVHVKGIIEGKAGKKWLNIIEYKAVSSKSGKGKHKK
jgi:hypothetical protein